MEFIDTIIARAKNKEITGGEVTNGCGQCALLCHEL